MLHRTEQLSSDVNRISEYLALDDFKNNGPDAAALRSLDIIVLPGNQVIATLTAACTLMQKAPEAALVLSGGMGHSTPLLYDNLLRSGYGGLVQRGLIVEAMPEAQMYAAVARASFGIPANRIVIEDESGNSAENARFSQRLLQDIHRPQESVLILQDLTMRRRSALTWAREAEVAGLHPRLFSHAVFDPRVQPGADGSLRFRDDQPAQTWTLERFLALILGEIRRLHDNEDGYGPKGRNFLPHVDIPETVLESYLRVLSSCGDAPASR